MLVFSKAASHDSHPFSPPKPDLDFTHDWLTLCLWVLKKKKKRLEKPNEGTIKD